MIGGLILAAGSSRRLGSAKQLLPLGGRPLLGWALAALRDFQPDQLVLVLGHEHERIKEALDLEGVTVVINPRHAEGQSTSLQAGIAAFDEGVSAVVVAAGDQPFVTGAHFAALLAEHRATGQPIVATAYGDHAGVPLLLARSAWPMVHELAGDVGARPLLRSRPELVTTVAADDPAMALDVDTPEAYAAVCAHYEKVHG